MNKQHLTPRILNQAKHEIPQQVLSSDKARVRLGWQPAYALEQGLQETIGWYDAFLGETGA